jgi:hypothetical protein
MVFISIHAVRPAMSDASAMTSGEEERTNRRNRLRAFGSPASASSEMALSSASRPLAPSDSSSAPSGFALAFASGTSVLSFASVESGVYQVGVGEDLCRLRQLLDRGGQGFQVLPIAPLSILLFLPLCLPELPPCAVRGRDDLGERAGPDVLAEYAAILPPAAGVVGSSAFSSLPRHSKLPTFCDKVGEGAVL